MNEQAPPGSNEGYFTLKWTFQSVIGLYEALLTTSFLINCMSFSILGGKTLSELLYPDAPLLPVPPRIIDCVDFIMFLSNKEQARW